MIQVRQECAGQVNAEAVEVELAYFVNNIQRMQYGTFRAQGFFIGSGVHRSRMQNRHWGLLQTVGHA